MTIIHDVVSHDDYNNVTMADEEIHDVVSHGDYNKVTMADEEIHDNNT